MAKTEKDASLETSTKGSVTHAPLPFIIVTLALIGIFILGLKWIFSLGEQGVSSAPFLLFDYAVGLTMIFLPCTLPLAFVIVPLVMGKSYGKGIGMALSFGIGVTITLSLYGALIGLLGQVLGVNQVETAKNILYAVAGLLAILFALGELNLIKFRAPTYTGGAPQFIMHQKDLVKAGLLGLFLGNVGVGCPNPLFNAVIIPQIIATGSPFDGFIIMVVQALGRITPLFILAFLAILGINATSFLVKHKDAVSQATSWITIFVGGFLLTLGLFGHDWWVISGAHTLIEFLTQENFITNLLGQKIGELGHTHGILSGTGLFGLPIIFGTPFLLAAWILPMLWYLFDRKRQISLLPPETQTAEKRYFALLFWFLLTVSILLVTIFGYLLPHMFKDHWSKMENHAEHVMKNGAEKNFYAQLSTSPETREAKKPFSLIINLRDRRNIPIKNLEIAHERILHVILVSEDLEEFKHVHPEDSQPKISSQSQTGEFTIPLTLSKAGRYRVLIEGRREGKEAADLAWITVGGAAQPLYIKKELNTAATFDGYQVALKREPDPIETSRETHLLYYISKEGKEINLDKYLGEDMHLALVPLDLSTIIHTHGSKEESAIDAHHVFTHPGLWKIYGQFQHKGRVVTSRFMVEVVSGGDTPLQSHMHVN